MENSDKNHGKLFHRVDASQSEFCSRKRNYPNFIDSNLKVENDNVHSDLSELRTDTNISVQFPSILKDKIGLITNLINPNYGLATIGFNDIGIVGVLFDTCEFWHDGSTLSQQKLVLQNVVSEGDWVKINAIKIVQNAQEDRNILYLATDIVKVENTNQDWCNLVQVNVLGDLPKEKIATFHAVTTFLKSVPLSKREKEMIQSVKCWGLGDGVSVTLKTLCKTVEEAKGNIKIEKPLVVTKDPNYKKGNAIKNPKVVPFGGIVSAEDKISVPILVPTDVLQGSKSFDIQESGDAKYNSKHEVNTEIPKQAKRKRKKKSKDKKGNINENPNVVPLGLKKPCTFGGIVSVEDLMSVPILVPKDVLQESKSVEIQESQDAKCNTNQNVNMEIPFGVPYMVKDKQGNVLENPNVASLGSKKQCTFGGKVSNIDKVSIIKWPNAPGGGGGGGNRARLRSPSDFIRQDRGRGGGGDRNRNGGGGARARNNNNNEGGKGGDGGDRKRRKGRSPSESPTRVPKRSRNESRDRDRSRDRKPSGGGRDNDKDRSGGGSRKRNKSRKNKKDKV